jgi:RimJ/RimL family protein N-acetyltransferase
MNHRLANEEDFKAVYDLYMDAASNPYLTYDPMNLEEFRPIFYSVLLSQTLYVVELDGTIIGTYRLISKSDRQSHTVYIGGFAVNPGMKGRGVGSAILHHIKKDCFAKGKSRIELTVDVNNTAAIALYKKLGFVLEGTVKNSYKLSSTNKYYNEYLMAVLQDDEN